MANAGIGRYVAVLQTVREAEIFKVYVGLWIEPSCGLDEGVNEFVILFTANTLLAESKVEIVVKQRFIVCATIQNHRKSAIWVYSSAKSRQDQLSI
jgi:hypothetical protein